MTVKCKCGSVNYHVNVGEIHRTAYCVECGKYIKHLTEREVKEALPVYHITDSSTDKSIGYVRLKTNAQWFDMPPKIEINGFEYNIEF